MHHPNIWNNENVVYVIIFPLPPKELQLDTDLYWNNSRYTWIRDNHSGHKFHRSSFISVRNTSVGVIAYYIHSLFKLFCLNDEPICPLQSKACAIFLSKFRRTYLLPFLSLRLWSLTEGVRSALFRISHPPLLYSLGFVLFFRESRLLKSKFFLWNQRECLSTIHLCCLMYNWLHS